VLKKKRLTLIEKRAITGLLFISPWLIGFIAFYVRSVIMAVQFSVSKLNMIEGGGFTLEFIGVENFRFAFLEDPTFNQILVESLSDILIDVPLIIFFSLFIAILLNEKFKGRTLIRAIFFLPVIMNSAAIHGALTLAQEAASGGVAAVSTQVSSTQGINIGYFIELFIDIGFPKMIMEYIIMAIERIYDIAKGSGIQIIIFTAALQSVPSALYEVSKMEGATAYETFWKVTFPMVSPLILTNVVYTIVNSFVVSEVVDKAYDMAFTSFNWGVSVAMSLVSTTIVCIILVILAKLISKKTFYYN